MRAGLGAVVLSDVVAASGLVGAAAARLHGTDPAAVTSRLSNTVYSSAHSTTFKLTGDRDTIVDIDLTEVSPC